MVVVCAHGKGRRVGGFLFCIVKGKIEENLSGVNHLGWFAVGTAIITLTQANPPVSATKTKHIYKSVIASLANNLQ